MVEWAMFVALIKAFGQLSDPALRRVVRLSILGAVGCYVALVALVWAVLPHVTFFDQGWADTGASIALGLVALVLPVLFFPALVTTIMSAMLDGVADAVELRHYPQLNWPRPQKWTEVLAGTLRFLLLTVAINLAALPIYAVLLFTGFTVVLAVVVNGYLLGREYFELAAGRFRPAEEVTRIRIENRGTVFAAGAVVAGLVLVPVLNLLTPIFGAAMMVHLHKRLEARRLSGSHRESPSRLEA